MMKKIILTLINILVLISCKTVYTEKANIPKEVVLQKTKWNLPDLLKESSGIAQDEEYFYTLNDSGGEAAVYLLNKKTPKTILKTIKLTNAKNKDWEDIALNDSLVFIGDFGNNSGTRKDLKIYYFPKNKIKKPEKIIKVEADTLSFFYPEQKEYTKNNHNHDYDLEAMFYYGGKIHLFTKQWKTLGTAHYTLDIIKGKQPAWLVETLKTNFLITAADIKPMKDKLLLAFVGYTKNGQAFLLKGEAPVNIPKNQWLTKGSFKQYKLGFVGNKGQIEGVTILSENQVCTSAESYKNKIFYAPQNITCLNIQPN